MGRFSIESYEQYRAVKCRPEEIRTPVPGAGFSSFTTVELRPGKETGLKGKTLLRVHAPSEADPAEAEAAVRAAGARYSRDPAVIGVTPGADLPRGERMEEALAEAFAPKRFYVPVTDGGLLNRALKRGFIGGLLAEVGEDPLDICEAFADNEAQRLYERIPVLVRFADPERADGRYARQWHALAVEGADVPAGPQIALRRLHVPEALTSGGFAPMRFWWTNRGVSPLYGRTEVRLRLVRDGRTVATVLPGDTPELIPLADRTFNRIVRLPELPEGVYRLEFGLFGEDGTPVRLANGRPAGDGWYEGDPVRIDHVPRPEMETVWASYRPDGYYPLEDPKQPGA